ncbi:phosphopyruvate hydratase [Deinococcus aluminii]|uniref:Enolase n=1 Tax=Deinococcus aluminii TaxID=1656885 RepID=A0ABP9XGL7_9DEIO
MKIQEIRALEILDSRGFPTLKVTLTLEGGGQGSASVPSGKSTGEYEAAERRDGEAGRHGGKGVRQAVRNVEEVIAPALMGQAFTDQAQIDAVLLHLDATPNKSRLGANALLGVSLAAARAAAARRGLPLHTALHADAHLLPVPCFNVLNGGAHADNPLAFQEFMLVPAGRPTYAEALRAGAECYHALARLLEDRGMSVSVGDEGGFAPQIEQPEDALDLLVRAVERAGYHPGEDVFIALDPAANGFYRDGRYVFGGRSLSSAQLTDLYRDWLGRYPILSLEDGLSEEDRDGWAHLTRALGRRVQLVGDDLFVTNPERLRQGIAQGLANALLVKPNQIGTLTETWAAAQTARGAGYRLMMSHRSGETDDSFIADLAVAMGTGQIKSGAPARGERLAKYNRLLEIERDLGDRARFAGRAAFGGEA